MSKYAIEARWDEKTKGYIARCKQLPDRVALGKTRYLAIKEMERLLNEKASAE